MFLTFGVRDVGPIDLDDDGDLDLVVLMGSGNQLRLEIAADATGKEGTPAGPKITYDGAGADDDRPDEDPNDDEIHEPLVPR